MSSCACRYAVQRADVLPVAVDHVTAQQLALVESGREHVAGEVDGLTRRDVVEDARLQDVDPGVDGVAEHLTPRGLLQEPLDPSVLAGDDDPELDGILDPLQRDGGERAGLLVAADDLGEVDVGQHVTGDHEERLVELVSGVAHRAGSSQRRVLGGVSHLDAELPAVAEVGADLVREERHGDHDLVEAVAREQLHDVLHHRPVRHRHHRLRLVAGQRAQPGALAAREDHGLHEASRPDRRGRSGRRAAPRGRSARSPPRRTS